MSMPGRPLLIAKSVYGIGKRYHKPRKPKTNPNTDPNHKPHKPAKP